MYLINRLYTLTKKMQPSGRYGSESCIKNQPLPSCISVPRTTILLPCFLTNVVIAWKIFTSSKFSSSFFLLHYLFQCYLNDKFITWTFCSLKSSPRLLNVTSQLCFVQYFPLIEETQWQLPPLKIDIKCQLPESIYSLKDNTEYPWVPEINNMCIKITVVYLYNKMSISYKSLLHKF